MRIARLGFALLFVLAASAAPDAQVMIQTIQGDPTQMPGPGREFKTGTGRIVGRVLAADTGNPIRRAQVRIMGPEIMPKAALTDTEGRYEFRDLPAGRFTLQATKSGFVGVGFGQTRPFESGRPIELADKQAIENADFVMPRGSVISGRILDEFGEPLADVAVNALRQTWMGGRRRLVPAGGRIGQTNDLGQFRIFGLPPGDYYISATLRSGGEMMAIQMMVDGGGAGPTGSLPASGYAPTYYPGTPNPAGAQRIAVAVGQENSGADFALVPVALARVSGIVTSSDGLPLAGAMVMVHPASRSEAGGFAPPGSTRTSKEGTFTVNGLPPGDYIVQAHSVQVMTTPGGESTIMFRGGFDGGTEFGSVPLSVAGDDLTGIVVVTSKGGTATGRVIFEDAAPPPPGKLVLVAPPADMDGPSMAASALVQPDGSFELKGLAGARLIRTAQAPGWTLKAVRLNGFDITDTGTVFRQNEAVSGLEVVLTSRSTHVTGSVVAANGSPVKDYTVVIFSDDPDHWQLPLTRWVTGTRPDQDGRFKVQNLPPGSYYAIALDYVAQGEWGDPELLDRLRIRARRFTLNEGDSQVLDLKMAEAH